MNRQTIAVTGAAGRLGSYLLEELVDRGARVAAFVLNDEEASRVKAHERVSIHRADLGAEASVREAFQGIGELSGLVHTVGGWGMTPLLETSKADFEKLVSLNLTTAFLCFREAARGMPGGGWLVAMASGQGADRGAPGQAAYSAAKAGVVRLVESVAAELAADGIQTLAVAPSMILFDPNSGEKGVSVHQVVRTCLSPWSDHPPQSGSVIRAYGTLTP